MLNLRHALPAVIVLAGFFSETTAAPPAPSATPLDQAVAGITVPQGFKVSLFAGEPDIRQPIALTFDARGRLWVVECYSYPQWEMGGKPGKDRVVIFEDENGDGKFDKRTVFWDKGANLSGIELGFGGVWLCSTPNLLFIPDRNGDDSPDSTPEVILDGWDLKARHNVFNGLIWGPDGWLWGCNGILSNSRVGAPGTPDNDRVAMNCGIWRYHPTRKVFEAVAHGTTNPWGLDFDDYGEAFLTNCVIPHLFHVIPGAHFQRMFGQDINPHSYDLIGSCADHVHWDTTERWLDIRSRGVTPTTDKAGGGHAHSGATICLSDNWPASYRNMILMGNIHGNRLNLDKLNRKGSGYLATHEPDFLQSSDRWFRSVAQKFGPDGALYALDWSDTGECHEDDADGAHRENGRIYRVSYGDLKPFGRDLSKLSDQELVALQREKNDAVVRISRRLLQERAAGKDLKASHAALRKMVDDEGEETRKLRALWALNASGGIDRAGLFALLKSPSENVRAWAIRLIFDDHMKHLSDQEATALLSLNQEKSPAVAMAIASALRLMPDDHQRQLFALLSMEIAFNGVVETNGFRPGTRALGLSTDRTRLAFEKAGYKDGGSVLSSMLWFGIEPTISTREWTPSTEMLVLSSTRFPQVLKSLARRMVEVDLNRGLKLQIDVAKSRRNSAIVDSILDGIAESLRGRNQVPMPGEWHILSERADEVTGNSKSPVQFTDETRVKIWRLSLLFGDPKAPEKLRGFLANEKASTDVRRQALEALAEHHAPGTAEILLTRLDDPALRGNVLRALSGFNEASIPKAILDRYKTFNDAEREDALATLSTRPEWAIAMMDAIAKGNVPRKDVSATIARQILAFNRPEVTSALEKSWGTLRPTAKDKVNLIAKYKSVLTPEALKSADLSRGRTLFAKTCQQCHKMYGEGGDVGPELTGSNRDNLDYVLENVLDPSASVGNDYKLVNVATTDGRLISGIIKERTPAALVLRTANDRVVIPLADIEAEKTSPASMMPEGVFGTLTDEEVRDLVAYLAARK